MKQNRTLIGIAAVVALAVVAVVLLTLPETQPPETGPTGATVAVPPDTAANQPAATATATATPEPVPAEAPAEAPAEVSTPAPAPAPAPAPTENQAQAPEAPAPETPTVSAPTQVATTPKAAETAPEVQPVAPPVTSPVASPAVTVIVPSFDVVRVERSGEAVIAGRAAPGSVVTLRAGNRVLGRVTADGRGQWVLVLDTPLEPGSYQLSLESRLPGAELVLSENVVVVSVPRPQVAAAKAVPEAAPEAAPEPVAPQQPEVATQPEAAQPEAPKQPEVVTLPEAVAPEAPAPQQAALSPPTPDTQAAQDPQAAQDLQATQDTPAAQPVAPSAQVAVVEPAAEVPAPAPATTAVQPAAEPEPAPPLAVLMPRSGEGQIRILQQAETLRGGLGEGTLVLETVDYDAQGRTRVGGRAEVGSRLVVYLDNRVAAQVEAASSGRWEATLVKPISPGLHTLRVDQLAGDGQVTARVETPFSRAAVLAALPSESAVIVQPGNSLWRISRRVYGEGVRFSVIYQANRDQIRDPDLIYPGQIFTVPTAD